MFELLFRKLDDLFVDFGALKAVKHKLLNQPDPAAERLAVALVEISKIHGAVQT